MLEGKGGKKEEGRGKEKIFQEIIAKNLPNMEKETLTQVEDA